MIRLVVAVILVVATVMLYGALQSRGLPDLRAWHRTAPTGEFDADDAAASFTFSDYQQLETALFAQLDQFAASGPGISEYSRYFTGGPHDPATNEPNWNRSIELTTDQPVGGALLLHGLTDSPYSMRTIARLLHDRGYYVLCLRVPGHGTVPAALTEVRIEDWIAAVEIAAAHVRRQVGDGRPLVIGGYSNGGALAMQYTLRTVRESPQETPDRVLLFSPAIGITQFARASRWHRFVSWLSYFEKAAWLGIEPEIDPYKYNSFPKDAGALSWEMAQAVQQELARAAAAGNLSKLPPILTFQSVIDATVVASELVTHLYNRLEPGGHELVVFDINNRTALGGFLTRDFRQILAQLQANTARPFRFTVITNASTDVLDVVERTAPAESAAVTTRPLPLAWPPKVYSLAHVSIPFPPDDPIYGEGRDGRLTLGNLAPRGERRMLTIPAESLLRLRYNPFHSYMIERIGEVIDATTAP
jgi:alpha-beta hydrolase superfamily lysophospholipase